MEFNNGSMHVRVEGKRVFAKAYDRFGRGVAAAHWNQDNLELFPDDVFSQWQQEFIRECLVRAK